MQVAVVVSVFPTITALAGILLAHADRKQTKEELKKVHLLINSRMDAWLAAAEALARVQGVAEGRELGAAETRGRTTERERVEDRSERKARHVRS